MVGGGRPAVRLDLVEPHSDLSTVYRLHRQLVEWQAMLEQVPLYLFERARLEPGDWLAIGVQFVLARAGLLPMDVGVGNDLEGVAPYRCLPFLNLNRRVDALVKQGAELPGTIALDLGFVIEPAVARHVRRDSVGIADLRLEVDATDATGKDIGCVVAAQSERIAMDVGVANILLSLAVIL